MPTRCHIVRMASTALVAVSLLGTPSIAQVAPNQRADSLLGRLTGNWRVSGDVRGQPAMYDMSVDRILSGRFVQLHMTDTHRPAMYEARVFLAADTSDGGVVAHWLDNFGGAYSVPPGFGRVSGDTVRLEFAYPTGLFRDTFVYHRERDAWDITLVSRNAQGNWQPFASYSALRVR